MIVISSINELKKNKKLILRFRGTNYQQTYENLYAIHLSNRTAKTYIDTDMITTFIDKNEDIIECILNIEPIININSNVLDFINEIKNQTNKILYFPLVYEDSLFYKLLKRKIHNYKRLYTSLAGFPKTAVLDNVKNDSNVYYSKRQIKKVENTMYLKEYKNVDVKDIITGIEVDSWKHNYNQDMITKHDQLVYYNELIKQGIAKITVAYTKDTDDLVAYRIDAIYANKVHILKNSYREAYKKYSIGTYMLVYDLFKKYRECNYIDLYGGPGLSKKIIEGKRINRYDMIYGDGEPAKELEKNRKKWDKKNYNIFLEGKSLQEVFNKKENILVATSCFGLGPVGKLNAIIESAVNKYNWYASGEQFDIGIFKSNVFRDCCFSLDKIEVKNFVDKYKIKYAVVVLKNKMARLLKEIGVKVVYVDSLPFMWTEKDALEGKVPYNVDVYCAQKTIELSDASKNIFSQVENLVWINPIVNSNVKNDNRYNDFIILNVGGLHSPNTDGLDYINAVVVPIIKRFKNKKILLTTSTKSVSLLRNYLKEYKNVVVKNLKQEQFSNYVKETKIFITSPGLTTILESCTNRSSVIFLPPQNISQFYNINYGKRVFKRYKEITWNDSDLTIENLSKMRDKNEHELITLINQKIATINNKDYSDYVNSVIESKYNINDNYVKIKSNGAEEVINELEKIINNDKGGK